MRSIDARAIIWVIIGLLLWGREAAATDPPLRMHVEEGEDRETVAVLMENVSDDPVTFYLDARRAEVVLRDGRRRLGRCRAPIPYQNDDRRYVTLEPGGVLGELLDLRFLCFGRLLDRLDRATSVEVVYRAPPGRDPDGTRSWAGRLGPVEHELTAEEPEEPGPEVGEGEDGPEVAGGEDGPEEGDAGPGEGEEDAEEGEDWPPLDLVRISRSPDVGRPDLIPVTLELRGPRRGRIRAMVRPEQFVFSVRGPDGEVTSCQLPPTGVRPLREFYSRLGRSRMRLDLAVICPRDTFDRPGIYEVGPGFVSDFDGEDVGLDAWTGYAAGQPFLVRVRRGGTSGSDPVERVVPRFSLDRGSEDAR